MNPDVTGFFDPATYSVSYLIAEPGGKHAAILDSVLDFDAKSGRTATTSADKIIAAVRQRGLAVDWILETHAHADHLSAASYLKRQLGGRIAIGEYITQVQKTFAKIFNVGPDFASDGSQFDHLLNDGETFSIGAMTARVIHTPGHTPACIAYVIGDAVFTGDTLFMPDYGTARVDFPGGDAATLYRSIRKVLALPPETRLFMCHDYGPGGRSFAWETTIAKQKAENIHIHDGIDEADFVRMRTARDKTLDMPALILPAIQINIRAGRFPLPEDNGVVYLKLPLNAF